MKSSLSLVRPPSLIHLSSQSEFSIRQSFRQSFKQPIKYINYERLHQIQEQNQKLQSKIVQSQSQINNLKWKNKQSQDRIEQLLKYNQSLRKIAQQVIYANNSYYQGDNSTNMEKSLQPISECTQVDSQLMDQLKNTLKSQNKLNKAQIAYKFINLFQSTHSRQQNPNQVISMIDQQNMQRSQRNLHNQKQYSDIGNLSSFSKKRQRKTKNEKSNQQQFREQQQFEDFSQVLQPLSELNQQKMHKKNSYDQTQTNQQKLYKMSQQLSSTLTKQLVELKQKSQLQSNLLKAKILESPKIPYNPEQQFNQLNDKLKMSARTAQLVKRAMNIKNK